MNRFSLAFILSLAFAPTAAAHITLVSPPPRANSNQKMGPCGGVPAGSPARFKPGETITVSWMETVSHGGHFQVAFSTDGEAVFKNPDGYTDIKATPVTGTPASGILADGLHMHGKAQPQAWEAKVALPDVVSERGVLRLIQVMTDRPIYNGSFDRGSSVYSQCADIVLAR